MEKRLELKDKFKPEKALKNDSTQIGQVADVAHSVVTADLAGGCKHQSSSSGGACRECEQIIEVEGWTFRDNEGDIGYRYKRYEGIKNDITGIAQTIAVSRMSNEGQ